MHVDRNLKNTLHIWILPSLDGIMHACVAEKSYNLFYNKKEANRNVLKKWEDRENLQDNMFFLLVYKTKICIITSISNSSQNNNW